jgi:hypothetical protein
LLTPASRSCAISFALFARIVQTCVIADEACAYAASGVDSAADVNTIAADTRRTHGR